MSLDDLIDERGMPASVDAERSILGAILLDNQAYYEADIITCNDFALDSHQRLFAAIARLMEDGHAVDIVTLAEDLYRAKRPIGRRSGLHRITHRRAAAATLD